MPKIILQPFGIGDVIHQMTAIRNLNDKILWPVLPEYVEGLNRAYPDIMFVDYKRFNIDLNRSDRYDINGFEVLPMRWQDKPLVQCMDNKYRYLGQNPNSWKQRAMYMRDINREHRFATMQQIDINSQYNLMNVNFGCWTEHYWKPGVSQISNPIIRNGLPTFDIKIYPSYSLFDWSTILENATEIHTVSTSLIYLFELLPMRAKEIHIYLRKPNEKNHDNYRHILQSHNYILHD